MNSHSSNENLYNNADSFAMAFDDAWKKNVTGKDKDKNIEEKIKIAFQEIETHPFLIENPIESKRIALFRIKLLGLY
ncbi:hypothetical protein [Prochlorococcus marinus]|uniref:hypothetical protein n=1 Tax=Prochlorococcus marinus TaxID=1219 RepID=UPI0022B53A8A|nr:hypothetical protein [Prochlorococcus marinus]